VSGPDAAHSTDPRLAAQYEVLRSAALGAPLPPDARHGLTLFLRRGLWGWARAVAAPTRASVPPPRVSAFSSVPDHLRGVIQIFAAMALASSHDRSAS
jgi:hypothetical protein